MENLKKIINCIPGNIYWKDLEGKYLGCNNNMAKVLKHHQAADIVGKTIFELIDPKYKDIAQNVHDEDLRIMAEGIEKNFEEIGIDSDGKLATYMTTKKPIFSKANKVTGLIGISINIKASKLSEDVSRQMKIVELLPENVYWKDLEGKYLGCNTNTAKTLKLKKPEDIIGKTLMEVCEPQYIELAKYVHDEDLKIMESGKEKYYEEEAFDEKGDSAIYLTRKKPIFDLRKKIIGLVGISINITKEKKADELKTQLEISRSENKILKAIAASIAHEIRTPLAGISFSNQAIEIDSSELSDSKKTIKIKNNILQSCKSIHNHVRRSQNIINMILANAKDPQIPKTSLKTLLIDDCVAKAVEEYPFQENEKELVHIHIEHDFAFQGEIHLFSNLINNLIKNSLYAIAKAGKGQIIISTKCLKDSNKLIFKDTGCGIPKDDVDHIFENFFSLKPRGVGTGLGLSFCKRVMESFNGKISCASKEGQHTTFTLDFPK